MGDGEDADGFGGQRVDEREGEAVQNELAEARIHRTPYLGTLQKKLRAPPHFSTDAPAQPRHQNVVPAPRLDESPPRLGVELQLHPLRRERRFSNTRSAGRGSAL